MGGKDHHHGEHGHGQGHGHDHHHHAPRIVNSVIKYEIPEPGHHVEPFKSPDWRIYKVENAPELLSVQRRLAALGLKDPWLRNEVWRYDPKFGAVSSRQAMIRTFTTGMKWGFILCVGTILVETGYNKLFGKNDHHGHGHH